MSRQELAKVKRVRRAERGPGFSNYANGTPSGRALRELRSIDRAAARKKAKEEAAKV